MGLWTNSTNQQINSGLPRNDLFSLIESICRYQIPMTVIDLPVFGSNKETLTQQNKIGKARVYDFHLSNCKHRQKQCNHYYSCDHHMEVFKGNIT